MKDAFSQSRSSVAVLPCQLSHEVGPLRVHFTLLGPLRKRKTVKLDSFLPVLSSVVPLFLLRSIFLSRLGVPDPMLDFLSVKMLTLSFF